MELFGPCGWWSCIKTLEHQTQTFIFGTLCGLPANAISCVLSLSNQVKLAARRLPTWQAFVNQFVYYLYCTCSCLRPKNVYPKGCFLPIPNGSGYLSCPLGRNAAAVFTLYLSTVSYIYCAFLSSFSIGWSINTQIMKYHRVFGSKVFIEF